MPIHKISKMDAARRQLDTTITMLFSEMDDIAIYTLVIAAGTVLRNLCKHAHKDSLVDVIMTPEHRKDYITHMSRASNFFKHADRDPNTILDWNAKEELNDTLILQACLDYKTVTGSNTWPMQYFVIWFALVHPNWITPEARTRFESKEAEAFRAATRQQRLKLGLHGISQQPETWKPYTLETTSSARS